MNKDYDIKIDREFITKQDDELQTYSETITRKITAKMDEIFITEIWENTGYCDTYKLASKEELTKFFEDAIRNKNKISELKIYIENILEETEPMTSISAEMKLRNEMRYIKEELEKLEEIVYEN